MAQSPMSWDQVAAFIEQLTPEQRSMPAVLWDANNDAAFTADDASVAGAEAADDVCPSEDFVEDGQPYLVFCL